MADQLKFVEEGVHLHASIAGKMDDLLATSAPVALGMPGLGTVIAAAAFVIGLIEAMQEYEDDAAIAAAINKLQQQIDEIKAVLSMLDQRIDELVDQVAIESNRQTLRDLLDYLDEFRIIETNLRDRPDDPETAVRCANEAGIVLDKFLRNDYEIWRWTDIVIKEFFNPVSGLTTRQNALSLLRFKNVPTLPVYVTGVLVWVAARERAVRAGQGHRLADDHARLERHRDATSVRSNFDKYRDDENGIPVSITEHIKSRIRAYAVASTSYPVNRICQFYFVVGSVMTGRSNPGSGFDIVMPPEADTCFLDSAMLGSPNEEIELETAAGTDALLELSELLARLAGGGSLRKPFEGVFATVEVFAPATLYVVDQPGKLQWYRNESAARRGGSRDWVGPRQIGGTQWAGYARIFNGGGHVLYGIDPSGDLWWWAHDGFLDGSGGVRGPNKVGNGWGGFRHVFGGGDYVVYAVEPEGRLLWYRHDGAPHGGDVTTWAGYREVDNGWNAFDKVFSGGDGVLYGIRPDGVLERRKHKGYLDGTPNWETKKEIGTGWAGFRDVVAAGNGVIYAFTRDGRVLWYRYAKPRPPAPPSPAPAPSPLEGMVTDRTHGTDIVQGAAHHLGGMVVERPGPHFPGVARPERPYVPGMETGPIYAADVEIWEGPVEIRRSFPAFRSVFALMPMPYLGPR